MTLLEDLKAITKKGTYTGWHGNVSAKVQHWILPTNAAHIRSVLELCVAENTRACVKGATWSLSPIAKPDSLLIDLGRFTNGVAPIRPVAAEHRNQAPKPRNAFFHIRGNVIVRHVNHVLAKRPKPYALPTSGAANGQTIAGAIATGSHGAAARFGAVHDAVRAITLITGPEQAWLVQPASALFNEKMLDALSVELGMAVASLRDDKAFGAALVGLGAVGVVYSVIVEVEPLYQLAGKWVDRDADHKDVLEAIRADNPDSLAGPGQRFNVAFSFNPYAKSGTAIWGSFLDKVSPTEPYQGPHVSHPRFGNAINFWVAQQSADLRKLFPQLVDWAMKQHYHDADPPPDKSLFPGDAFGDTTLVEGMGRGMEVIVHRSRARDMLDVLLGALRNEGKKGRYLAGAMGMRYVGASRHALLGMNSVFEDDEPKRDPKKYGVACFEIGALAKANDGKVERIFSACRAAARESGIPFTLHWGLETGDLRRAELDSYFKRNVADWVEGRKLILPTPEQQAVFRNPLTDQVGLTK